MIDDISTGIKLLFQARQLVEIRGKRLDGTIFSKFFTDHDRTARVLAKVVKKAKLRRSATPCKSLRPTSTGRTSCNSDSRLTATTVFQVRRNLNLQSHKPRRPRKSR
jgi:hypothetical protein